jgi:hypothetical protein
MMSNDHNGPIHRIRLGVIAASVFANETDKGTYFNVQVDRSYRDGEDWKHTKSFGRDDLLNVAKVVDLAHSWIHAQQQAQAVEVSTPEPDGP